MGKTQRDNRFLWSGVSGGACSLLIFFAGGNLPIAIASGAAIFAAGSYFFKKPKQSTEKNEQGMDEATLLAKGREGVLTMHHLIAEIEDNKIRINADEVAHLCDVVIGMVSEDTQKLLKSAKLFTYYIPTINKTLQIYHKLEESDTDHTVYDTTNRFLDDCQDGLRKYIKNLSHTDLTKLSVEMETMTNVMNIDGLLNRMQLKAASTDQKKER